MSWWHGQYFSSDKMEGGMDRGEVMEVGQVVDVPC